MTEPKNRTAPIDAAIAGLSAEIGKLMEARRDAARDINTDPQQLATMTAQLQALRDKLAGQRELREEAAKLDAKDTFLAQRKRLKEQCAEVVARLRGERAAAARKLDRACALLAEALGELDTVSKETWREFVDVARALGLPKRVVDSAIDLNQSRILTGGVASTALVHALKEAGLGSKGITSNSELFASLQQPTWWGLDDEGKVRTVEQAMAEAAQVTERDLDRLFQQAESAAVESLDA